LFKIDYTEASFEATSKSFDKISTRV